MNSICIFPWPVIIFVCNILLNCSCTPFHSPRITTKNTYFVLMPLTWRKVDTGWFFLPPCLGYLWHYLATDGGEIWWRLQSFLWEGDQWNLHSPQQRLQRGRLVRTCNFQALQTSCQHWFAAFGPPATVGKWKSKKKKRQENGLCNVDISVSNCLSKLSFYS